MLSTAALPFGLPASPVAGGAHGTGDDATPARFIQQPGGGYSGPFRVWGWRGDLDRSREWVWEIVADRSSPCGWCSRPLIEEWWNGWEWVAFD